MHVYSHILSNVLINSYQINKNDEIQIRDRLVIKALISYQRTISI